MPCLKLGEMALLWYHLQLLLFSHSVISNSFATPWTVAFQALPFMGFPRQEYWSGLPFPHLGDLPDLGLSPRFLVSFCGFTTEPTRKPTPMFFLLDPLSLKATKRPRDKITHTEHTTIRTSIEASVSWGSPRPFHILKKKKKGNVRICGKDEWISVQEQKI